ncbi:hypothetical protein GALL_547020 [mine drainage metagenome]|uniref:Uncharacterized protein n=1 Tax=mine drainage metagenome TaxID=410659 RepID=A0A1J5P8H4_9ZZZZ
MHNGVRGELADACGKPGSIEDVTNVVDGGAGGSSHRFAVEASNRNPLLGQILNQSSPDNASASGNKDFFHENRPHFSRSHSAAVF